MGQAGRLVADNGLFQRLAVWAVRDEIAKVRAGGRRGRKDQRLRRLAQVGVQQQHTLMLLCQ